MTDKIVSFTQLDVWKFAHKLVLAVYTLTRQFPTEEKFGLVSQMRRCAVSVPANIAEGFKRRGKKDKIHFYNIAQASLEELRYFFILSNDLGYKVDVDKNREKVDQIGRMLHSLIESVKSTINTR